MPRKSNAAKARAANLTKVNKANAARKASASIAPVEEVEQDQPPNKKQRTEPPQVASQPPQVASQPSQVAPQPQPQVSSAPPSATAKEVPTNDINQASAATAQPPTPSNGSFCLYDTSLPFLQSALIPDAKTGTKNYSSLFTKLKELQAKPDRTAQCYVHFPTSGGVGYGRFSSGSDGFTEPMGDEPYDIGIAGLKEVGQGSLKGAAVLATSDCGVTSARGEFTIRTVPVWKNGEKEIYEGYVEFKVKYGMYARKGHGSGTSTNFAFWAIRSRAGDELEEGNVAHLANDRHVSALESCGGPCGDSDSEFDELNMFDEDDDYGCGSDRAATRANIYPMGASIYPMGSSRYRRWFEHYREIGVSYSEWDSDEEYC